MKCKISHRWTPMDTDKFRESKRAPFLAQYQPSPLSVFIRVHAWRILSSIRGPISGLHLWPAFSVHPWPSERLGGRGRRRVGLAAKPGKQAAGILRRGRRSRLETLVDRRRQNVRSGLREQRSRKDHAKADGIARRVD